MRMTRSNRQCPPPACPSSPTPFPWLVFPHNFKSKTKPTAVEKQTFCTTTASPSPPNNNKSYFKSIPELRGKFALGCHHGWLLLIDRDINDIDNWGLSLWNPVSFQALSLPPRPSELRHYIDASVLTCPPEDEGSLVVLFSRNRAAFCRPGDDAWVVQTCEVEGYDEKLCFCEVIVCNGVLYGRIQGPVYDIIVIEINSDGSSARLSFQLLRRLELSETYYASSPRVMMGMAEGCGEVYLFELYLDICTARRVIGVVTRRLDLARMAWVKVKSFNGHVFFRCNGYSVSCLGESYSEGLYFVLSGDNTQYFYRVEDASVTAILPCANLKTSWLSPFWVLPCYPRLLAPKEIEEHIEDHRIEESDKNKKPDNLEIHQSNESADVIHAKNETTVTIFSKLPEHLITLIAEHLPLFDYLDFRSTCKYFCTAAPLIQYRKLTSLEAQNHPPPPPLLMVRNNYRDCIETNDVGDPLLWDAIHPSRLDAKYPMSIPKSFEGATITFSSKGWLLARKKCDSLLFLNPFTRVSGEYPRHESLAWFPGMSFSTAPTSPDCVTIAMSEFTDDRIVIKYFQHGDETWNHCEFPPHEKGFKDPPGSICPVYHDGAFYFLDKEGYLGVFELKEGQGSWRVFDKHIPMRCPSMFSNNIVECDGRIVAVVVGHMGKWVDVFRWDRETEGWNKVESLGNWTVFINPSSSCFSTEARRPQMGNKIYFPRFYGGRVVFYSMEMKKWHFDGSKEALSDFYGTKELLNCCWIEPSWSE